MNKKSVKKLELNRESLRRLDTQELQAVVGGSVIRSDNTQCTQCTCRTCRC